jgi:hypothetical protein
VARKSKIETEKPADGQGSEPDAGGTRAEPKATGAAAKPRQKKAAPKKKTVRKPAASKKAPPSAPVQDPSDEQIRLRAYFIAERRLQLSLAGDSAHDWIEAKRQLIEEAGRASS